MIEEVSNTFANKRAVENLENSDGWNFKPKKLNQDEWLLTSWPKNRTRIKSNKEIKLVSPDNLDELIQYLHNEAKVI